jgi:putative glycosyltransferase (TIGR04348 family)
MNIILITPAAASSWSGNRVTADRWARILRGLGHRIRVAGQYDGSPADLMIALHAWRSAEAIRRFRHSFPDRPLIVALTGTDAYDYIRRDPRPTLRSLQLADRLVALHGLVRRAIPPRFRGKLRVILQSARPLPRRRPSMTRAFEVAVIAQLREIKDPLRAALAARRLPVSSRIRIIHLGAAVTPEWATRAIAEMKTNPRYVWRGEVPGGEARRVLGRARALVLSSRNEGGANVISEAVVAGVPVLTARIDAAVALLGRNYPGYFAVGNTAALARLLHRIETDAEFLNRLRRALARRIALFAPAREIGAWKKLLAEVASCSSTGGSRRRGRRAR